MTDGHNTLSHAETTGIQRKVMFVCTGVKFYLSLAFLLEKNAYFQFHKCTNKVRKAESSV